MISAVAPPAERLDGDFYILFEINGVGDMPAVKRKPLIGVIQSVGPCDVRKPRIKRAEFAVSAVDVKIPRAAEIVLGARSAYRGEFAVAVKVELDFSFSPPAVVVHLPGKIGPDVLSAALDAVDNRVYAALGRFRLAV